VSGSLNGKIALVTGGGSGIGRATSIMFAEHGAQVAVADRNTEGAEETRAAIVKAGGRAIAINVEVSDSASVDRMVATAEKDLGKLDILVHGAGILKIVAIVETSDEDWRRVLAVNLDGTFYAARAAARVMLPRKSGRIILITSGHGAGGGPMNAAYSASKGGVNAFMLSLAKELQDTGIYVNAIDPGSTLTPLQQSVPGNLHSKRIAGKPEEVAEVILFAASNQARVTGQILSVRMR
jgi:NAD(P)-dependent dehydrogenase (short-subunit alcohol dehydrogenase family)